MKLALRRRGPRPDHAPVEGAVAGTARVDRRTKNLMARIMPGEVAVIDHDDMDRVSSEGLVQRKVGAVVNAGRSSTGRYPNLGPLLLCSAGIPVVDDAGPAVMEVPEGTRLVIDGGKVFRDLPSGRVEIASGRRLELVEVEH